MQSLKQIYLHAPLFRKLPVDVFHQKQGRDVASRKQAVQHRRVVKGIPRVMLNRSSRENIFKLPFVS